MMRLEDMKIRVDELIQKGEHLSITRHRDEDGLERIDATIFAGLKTAVLSLVLKIYDEKHPFYTEVQKIRSYDYPSSAKVLVNVLKSVKEEVEGNWLFTTKGLVSAEIFSDFMDMAEHLLQEGYKDPAAVLIGGVLEEHLRQLCQKHGIEIKIIKDDKEKPKKANLLNQELSSKKIYNMLDQKTVTGWLELRNDAAHGKYSEYDQAQVKLMFSGVLDFITRNSI